jgi:hypothetical protein
MKIKKEQLEFARGMNARQWNTLSALNMFPFHLSASERGDPELYALIRNGLASCQTGVERVSALYSWMATDIGGAVMRLKQTGRL